MAASIPEAWVTPPLPQPPLGAAAEWVPTGKGGVPDCGLNVQIGNKQVQTAKP